MLRKHLLNFTNLSLRPTFSHHNITSLNFIFSFSAGKLYYLLIMHYVSESHKGLLKQRSLSPISRISDSVGSGWDQGIHVFSKFPSDSDIVGLECWRVQAFTRRQGLFKDRSLSIEEVYSQHSIHL